MLSFDGLAAIGNMGFSAVLSVGFVVGLWALGGGGWWLESSASPSFAGWWIGGGGLVGGVARDEKRARDSIS